MATGAVIAGSATSSRRGWGAARHRVPRWVVCATRPHRARTGRACTNGERRELPPLLERPAGRRRRNVRPRRRHRAERDPGPALLVGSRSTYLQVCSSVPGARFVSPLPTVIEQPDPAAPAARTEPRHPPRGHGRARTRPARRSPSPGPHRSRARPPAPVSCPCGQPGRFRVASGLICPDSVATTGDAVAIGVQAMGVVPGDRDRPRVRAVEVGRVRRDAG